MAKMTKLTSNSAQDNLQSKKVEFMDFVAYCTKISDKGKEIKLT